MLLLGDISKMDQYLSQITHVNGYVKVVHTTAIRSLSFFRNLKTIGGEQLVDDK